MPNMANITVKDASNVDVVWTAATPSAGDRSPAVWRSNSVSEIPQYRPSFSLVLKNNGKGNGRIFHAEYAFPITGEAPVTGAPYLMATIPFRVDGTLPMNISTSAINQAFVQFGNLLVSTLVRSAAQDGYSPT